MPLLITMRNALNYKKLHNLLTIIQHKYNKIRALLRELKMLFGTVVVIV